MGYPTDNSSISRQKPDYSIFFLVAVMILSLLMSIHPSNVHSSTASKTSTTSDTSAYPRIGLVLGGGGALGLAHVGVLKELEARRIPIDCIAGTSMGAIIGGLYASGMSPAEIENLLLELDWNDVMSDDTPRRELFFRRKIDDQRYLFEVGAGLKGIKMTAGIAAGQKFNNLMEFVTLRAATISDFDLLPIPFRAVATDLRTGQPFVIGSGNLAQAMRASMAVPGAFTPVMIDDHVLIDGGIVDNLPVDVAEAMGADIVIAVDVGASAARFREEDLKSLAGILARAYAIAQRPEQERMFRRATVGIQPDLEGMIATQFERVAEFIARGEAAAQTKASELAEFSVTESGYTEFLARQRRTNPKSVTIGAIDVTGNLRVDESIILGRITTRPGMAFDRHRVSLDLQRIYGIGEFEQVMFHLQPGPDGTSTLNFDITEKSWGPTYFQYGFRLQSDFEKNADWAMLLGMRRMSINRLGAEWKTEGQVGSEHSLFSEFYQPLDHRGFFFIAPNFEYKSELQNVYEDDQRIAEYDVKTRLGRLDFGFQLRQHAELRIGPWWGEGETEIDTGSSDLPQEDDTITGLHMSLITDRQDRTMFARFGSYLKIEAAIARTYAGGDREFDRLFVLHRWQHSFGDHTVFTVAKYGTSFGGDLPGYAQFTDGGLLGFGGIAKDQFRGDDLAVASIGYQYRLLTLPSSIGRAVYFVTRADYGNIWQSDEPMEISDCRSGGLVALAADTIIGPVFAGIGFGDEGTDRYYFMLGNTF